ncbi:MAG: flagellar biosynthesis anti-sigma factor FlgM [Clostridiaceae bacterium]|jgi:negative regulator of flagellin synthesis FlgM|nr:flagellar biosynthesis anti-sigma factor FlgM [Clostridiaceae bacterium]
MKIWGDNPRVFGVYNHTNTVGKVQKTENVASKRDGYKISSQAKDYQAVMKALRDVPDIRQDKVREISERLESGQYKVETRDISDKIISKLLGKAD